MSYSVLSLLCCHVFFFLSSCIISCFNWLSSVCVIKSYHWHSFILSSHFVMSRVVKSVICKAVMFDKEGMFSLINIISL